MLILCVSNCVIAALLFPHFAYKYMQHTYTSSAALHLRLSPLSHPSNYKHIHTLTAAVFAVFPKEIYTVWMQDRTSWLKETVELCRLTKDPASDIN